MTAESQKLASDRELDGRFGELQAQLQMMSSRCALLAGEKAELLFLIQESQEAIKTGLAELETMKANLARLSADNDSLRSRLGIADPSASGPEQPLLN